MTEFARTRLRFEDVEEPLVVMGHTGALVGREDTLAMHRPMMTAENSPDTVFTVGEWYWDAGSVLYAGRSEEVREEYQAANYLPEDMHRNIEVGEVVVVAGPSKAADAELLNFDLTLLEEIADGHYAMVTTPEVYFQIDGGFAERARVRFDAQASFLPTALQPLVRPVLEAATTHMMQSPRFPSEEAWARRLVLEEYLHGLTSEEYEGVLVTAGGLTDMDLIGRAEELKRELGLLA